MDAAQVGVRASYMTSVMDGLNQNARNVPDSSSTMKLNSAISPSRNDQWSGNALRMLRLSQFEAVICWSTKSTTLPALLTTALVDDALNSSGPLTR